ncbi:PHP domain-containing protein [Micromonospora sp. B11E3]|uniref:PHP domain-containing protein n=1 Tax=Micromonospora sp. B11E3 TaxID=3153562 RepID=UPI00325E720C
MPGVAATVATPVDLHLHTRCSDGDETPAGLAARCLAAGLRIVAVTDHNTMAGVEPFARAAGAALTVLPGCEITATWRGEEVHCLAYLVDPADPVLGERLRRVHDGELTWWRAWAGRAEELGVPLGWARVAARLGGDRVAYVGDYLALLAEAAGEDPRFRGYGPDTYWKIADDWCRPGQPLHVPQPWRPHLTEVLTWVADAGGVAVLAHPAALLASMSDAECLGTLREWATAGLAGIEVWTSWHTPEESARLERLCAAAELTPTVGSDYHGPRVKRWVSAPGLLPTRATEPYALVDALRGRQAGHVSGVRR